MRIVNLTGKSFALYAADGELVDVAPDARYVGLVSIGDHRTIHDENGRSFSLNVRRIRDVKGLPDPAEGSLYVVPIEVAMALGESREDVVYLAEEEEVRSADGRTRRVSHLRRTVTSFEKAPDVPSYDNGNADGNGDGNQDADGNGKGPLLSDTENGRWMS